jgi:ketosteroid isomerase-like protein
MKKSTNFLILIAATLLLVSSITSCNNKAEETTETVVEAIFNLTTAKVEIEAANQEFMAFFAASDSVGLANLYTQDAKLMNTGAPAITGRKNIQSALSGIMKSGISSANLITLEVWGSESLITEEGEVSLFVNGDEVYQGKYMVLWKKDDGKWKLFRDIFNSNLPAE